MSNFMKILPVEAALFHEDRQTDLPRWCLHLNVVGEFASFWDQESYAGGSVATGRATQAGQVKG